MYDEQKGALASEKEKKVHIIALWQTEVNFL